jgi:hypothetical protein
MSCRAVLYLARDDQGVLQLVTLDLNPASPGDAPVIADVTVAPEFVLLEGRSTATVRARVSTPLTLLRASVAALHGGLFDGNVSTPVLLDDGSRGDSAAGDSIFSSNELYANCCAVVGPHTVRVKAEVRGGDGRRHATVVEVEPFEVRQP